MSEPTYRAITGIVEQERPELKEAVRDAVARHIWWTGKLPENQMVTIVTTQVHDIPAEYLTEEFYNEVREQHAREKVAQRDWFFKNVFNRDVDVPDEESPPNETEPHGWEIVPVSGVTP